MTQAVIQTTVTGMQGRPIATTVPAANQAYTWSGTAWVPTGPFLPLAGGILTGALRLQYAAPVSLIYNDTTTSITAGGLWRIQVGAASLTLQSNTATAGDFSTTATPISFTTSAVNIGLNTTIGASCTITGNGAVNGTLTAANANVNGTLNVGANIAGNGSRVFSIGTGNQPSVIVLDLNRGYAVGMSQVVSNGALGFCVTSANGIPTSFFATIDTGGNMNINGGLSQGSDETTKNNIAAYAPGVSIAAQLLPKTFIYNGDETNTQRLGFIAQDVQPLIPDAVTTNSLGETPTLSLDLTAIVAVLANAVKQLISRVAAVESHDNITPTAAQTA